MKIKVNTSESAAPWLWLAGLAIGCLFSTGVGAILLAGSGLCLLSDPWEIEFDEEPSE